MKIQTHMNDSSFLMRIIHNNIILNETYIPMLSEAVFLYDKPNLKSELLPELRYSRLEFEILCHIFSSIKACESLVPSCKKRQKQDLFCLLEQCPYTPQFHEGEDVSGDIESWFSTTSHRFYNSNCTKYLLFILKMLQ